MAVPLPLSQKNERNWRREYREVGGAHALYSRATCGRGIRALGMEWGQRVAWRSVEAWKPR